MQIIAEFHQLKTLTLEECKVLLTKTENASKKLAKAWELLFEEILKHADNHDTAKFEGAYTAFNSVDNFSSKISEMKFKIIKRVAEIEKLNQNSDKGTLK